MASNDVDTCIRFVACHVVWNELWQSSSDTCGGLNITMGLSFMDAFHWGIYEAFHSTLK